MEGAGRGIHGLRSSCKSLPKLDLWVEKSASFYGNGWQEPRGLGAFHFGSFFFFWQHFEPIDPSQSHKQCPERNDLTRLSLFCLLASDPPWLLLPDSWEGTFDRHFGSFIKHFGLNPSLLVSLVALLIPVLHSVAGRGVCVCRGLNWQLEGKGDICDSFHKSSIPHGLRWKEIALLYALHAWDRNPSEWRKQQPNRNQSPAGYGNFHAKGPPYKIHVFSVSNNRSVYFSVLQRTRSYKPIIGKEWRCWIRIAILCKFT